MKVKILGSNGWFATETGNTICVLIESRDFYVVLDAGDGISKLDEYITSSKPILLFLSHFHFDHICGFHTFNKFRFNNQKIKEIEIFGQPGTAAILEKIVAHPYTVPFEKLGLEISVRDLSEGSNQPPQVPLLVECGYLDHSEPCFGYRFSLDNKNVAYCVDTGICDNLLYLARQADFLIAECSFKAGQQEVYGLRKGDKMPHLNPESAARIAEKAGAKRLLLIHFDANLYRTIEERKKAEQIARNIFPNTDVCLDGMELELE